MAGQGGSAGAKRTKNKQMSAVLKDRKEERESGKCCICYGTIRVDRPEKTQQGAVEAHMAGHARGNI